MAMLWSNNLVVSLDQHNRTPSKFVEWALFARCIRSALITLFISLCQFKSWWCWCGTIGKNSEERRSSLFQSQCSKEAIAVIWGSETDNFVDCGDFLKPKLFYSTLKGTQTESTDINFFFVQKSVTIMRKYGENWHCRKQSEGILTNVLVISHLQGITFCVKDVMKAERPGKTILRFPKLS